MAAKRLVVYLEVLPCTTTLTSPVVSLKHLPTQSFVLFPIRHQAGSFRGEDARNRPFTESKVQGCLA